MCEEKYVIEWYDPEDPEGMRIKKWKFTTIKEAEEWRKELALVWKNNPKDIHITKIKPKIE